MKKLVYLLLLVSFTVYSQNDTIALADQVIKSLDIAYENDTELEDMKSIISQAEELYRLKNDKTKTAYVIGSLYYRMATRYDQEGKGTVTYKELGHLTSAEQLEALNKAKEYFKYHISNAVKNDEIYRAAKQGYIQTEKQITKIKSTQ